MATRNEQIVQERIEQQKGRTDDALAAAALLIALLDSSEPLVRVIIERYLRIFLADGVQLSSGIVQAQMAQMRAEILDVRTQSFLSVGSRLDSLLVTEIEQEWDFLVKLYLDRAGLQLQRPGTTPQTLVDTPVLGRTVDDWLQSLLAADAGRIADAVAVGAIQQRSRTQILQATLGEENLDGGNGATERTRRDLTNIVDLALFSVVGLAAKTFSLDNIDMLPRDLYVAVIDNRTTQICRHYNGMVFVVGEGPYPPIHWHCRSIRVSLPADGDIPNVA